jgi:hypothetical protein
VPSGTDASVQEVVVSSDELEEPQAGAVLPVEVLVRSTR